MLYTRKPTEYQLANLCANMGWNKRGLPVGDPLTYQAIIWDPGCGKSKMAVDIIQNLYQEDFIDLAVIVCPNEVMPNWVNMELPLNLHPNVLCQTNIFHYKSNYHHSTKSILAKEDFIFSKGLGILVIAYSMLFSKHGSLFVSKLLTNRRKSIMILDESHKIKNGQAMCTRAALAFGEKARFRRIMTGTPVANSPFDYYSQMEFLQKGFWKKHGIASYRQFTMQFGQFVTAEQFFQMTGKKRSFDQLTGYKGIDKLEAIIRPYISRVAKKDALPHLPDQVYKKHFFELSSKQTLAYKQLVATGRVNLSDVVKKDQEVTEDMSCVARLSFHIPLIAQQITCGYVPATVEHINDDEEIEVIERNLLPIEGDNTRLDALMYLIENEYADQPVVIWCKYTRDIEDILCKLGDEAARFDGRISPETREDNKNKFISGEKKYFVGNSSMGVGYNLINASTVIFYNNSFKLTDRIQSENRSHRIGQESLVTYIDLVAFYYDKEEVRYTVDNKVIDALRIKKNVASAIHKESAEEWI